MFGSLSSSSRVDGGIIPSHLQIQQAIAHIFSQYVLPFVRMIKIDIYVFVVLAACF